MPKQWSADDEEWLKASHGAKRAMRAMCRAFAEQYPVDGLSREQHEKATLELALHGFLQFEADEQGNIIGFKLTEPAA